jgi:ABC-type dipeptide/oligopeptide/nickel transport system ATPase component
MFSNGFKVLIADEPTTALDVFVQEQILVLIKTLIKKRNMSMILITHNMGVVYKVADEVIVMKDAKIVEVNTPKVLFQNPRESYTKRLIASLPPKDITVKKIGTEKLIFLHSRIYSLISLCNALSFFSLCDNKSSCSISCKSSAVFQSRSEGIFFTVISFGGSEAISRFV